MRPLLMACLLMPVLSWTGETRAIEGGRRALTGDPLALAPAAGRGIDFEAANRVGLSHCSGVLIAADLVVTAAHCVPAAENLAAIGVFLYQGAQQTGAPVRVTAILRRGASKAAPRISANDLGSTIRQLGADFAVLQLAHPVNGRK